MYESSSASKNWRTRRGEVPLPSATAIQREAAKQSITSGRVTTVVQPRFTEQKISLMTTTTGAHPREELEEDCAPTCEKALACRVMQGEMGQQGSRGKQKSRQPCLL